MEDLPIQPYTYGDYPETTAAMRKLLLLHPNPLTPRELHQQEWLVDLPTRDIPPLRLWDRISQQASITEYDVT